MSLTKVSHMPPVDTVVVFVVKGDQLLMVQNKAGKWSLPGGLVNAGESPWDAMKRTYREAVGASLPRLAFSGASDFGRFVFEDQIDGNTGIYVGITQDDLETVVSNFSSNWKIKAIRLVDRFELRPLLRHVRRCAEISLNYILNEESVQTIY